MTIFVNSVFTSYLSALNDVFSNSNRALFLMLFVIVLISIIFKVIARVR